ncbi:MAG: fasciclin domain-containing protein [Pseudomonadota bacterium]
MTRTFFRPFLATAASALVLAACNSADAPSETAEYEAVEDAAAETDTAMSDMDSDTGADANVDRDADGGEVELDGNAITDIAAGDARFSTLVTALQAANLTDTLDNTNVEYTVFAPTNQAFTNLPEGVLVDLLQPEKQQQLQTVLTYYVVPGKLMAADLAEAIRQNGGSLSVDTVVEEDLMATIEDGMVVLTDTAGNTARVIDTDIEASNGVIHVIDTVVLPNS